MGKKLRATLVITLALSLVSSCTSYAQSMPILMDDNKVGNEGDWYVGDTPKNVDKSKPVIVFVQGLHGNAPKYWWGETEYYGKNDIYDHAYNSGYRTAFVNFRDADGNAGDMWRNGEVLRNQLEKICNYYGVSKVNLVCHSKGGIDAQSAIVHYGANKFVDRVFTLSTPHWGSQVADLAYSWYGGWLADLLESKDEGTYVLQTGYMSYFRSITDHRPENDSVSYYTSAGTNWGPFSSSLWCGGLYLKQYGKNDGLVTVENAKNPRATHINTSDLNHDNIRIGSKVWHYVEPIIRVQSNNPIMPKLAFAAPSIAAADTNSTVFSSSLQNDSNDNYILRGGKIEQSEEIIVPIDSSIKEVTFDLMAAKELDGVKMISPDGKEYKLKAFSSKSSELFSGAVHYVETVKRPKAGKWKIEAQSKQENAYFLVSSLDSPIKTKMVADKPWSKARSDLSFDFKVDHQTQKKVKRSKVTVNLNKSEKGSTHKVKGLSYSPNADLLRNHIEMPSEQGLYSFSGSVEGELEDGSPFERSFVKSIVVEAEGQDKVETLKKIKLN